MSAKPQRIRLQRKRGFKLQEVSRALNGLEAVNVQRPTKWGNPYPAAIYGRDMAVMLYERTVRGIWWCGLIPANWSDEQAVDAYEAHSQWLARMGEHPIGAARRELRGKNLACWCSIDKPCHADVLLELANKDSVR